MFLASRQIGKSHLLAHICVEKAWTNPGTKSIILSTGERAANEVLAKVKKIAKVFELAFADTPANFKVDITSGEVRLSNGSVIVTLPSTDTAKIRGYSPILLCLDEFSLVENQSEFYDAIFPSISSPFGGKKSLIISSTPMGTQNLFWRLWTEKNDYAKYSINIYQAKDAGLKVDIDLLKKNMPDIESFNQEFMCLPMDSVQSLFSLELLNSITYEKLPPVIARYFGIDIGRRHDKTSVCIIADTPEGAFVEDVKTFSGMEFQEQFNQFNQLIKAYKPRKVSIDQTGLGMQLAEDLTRAHGALIDGVTFTAQSKLEMFNNLKKSFSQSTCKIPDSAEIKKDLLKIRRVVTLNNVSYQADSDEDGHADIAVSIALAYRAYLLSNRECDFMPFTL